MKTNFSISADDVIRDLSTIRLRNPLVQNITNMVTANLCANSLLAVGASPVMTYGSHDSAEMLKHAAALVLNIGTLDTRLYRNIILAGNTALSSGIPVVFDPVGVAATPSRMKAAVSIIDKCRPSVIKGNPSEINALSIAYASHSDGISGLETRSHGVDSVLFSPEILENAVALATATDSVVSVSGSEDYVTDGKRIAKITNGSDMMRFVTGMGCTASSITGACASVNRNFFSAAVSAMAIMGIAAEIASSEAKGPASFQVNFIDALYALSPADIKSRLVTSSL